MRKKIVIVATLALMLFSNTVYGATVFKDIKASDWYYTDVVELEAEGIVAGYPDNTFRPQNSITSVEVLQLILRATGVMVQKDETSNYWAADLIKTAIAEGIVESTGFEGAKEVTRVEVANMLVKAMKLTETNSDLQYFMDSTNRAENILVELGILSGVATENGIYFYPNSKITRAEISSIIARVNKYNIAKGTQETEIPEEAVIENNKNFALYPVLTEEEKEVTKDPMTAEAFEKIFVYMASENLESYEIIYNDTTFDVLKDETFKAIVVEAFAVVFSKYPEYFSYTNGVGYEISGKANTSKLIIKLNSDFLTKEQIKEMKPKFYAAVEGVVIELIENEKITKGMTDKEKAKVLFEWVANNTKYDKTLQPESYTGYGQIVNGLAVCQGYTATYNLMCKMVGLEVWGITGLAGTSTKEEHIWTLANLDGEIVHIDVTWGDSAAKEGEVNYDYFATNSKFMSETHTWDKKQFGQ